MVFHRFQQLPAELRLQIWECAMGESRPVPDGQKRVCRIIGFQLPPESPASSIQASHCGRDLTIRCVCLESREFLRRRGRLNKSRDCIPTTDVVYIDNYDFWVALDFGSLRQVRHIALSANFCYEMLKIEDASPAAFAKLGCLPFPRSRDLSTVYLTNFQWDSFTHAMVCCPELESITVVLPPLETDMPHYADHIPQPMLPAVLRVVPYSDIQRIRITGPYTYTTCLRENTDVKRRFLGPFIKDVNEMWQIYGDHHLGENDQRRNIMVQAGVLRYLAQGD